MPDKNPVAIIGMGCLFPKSTGLKDYWKLLYHGKDAISEIPDSHWSPDEYFDTDPKTPDHVYCKRGGFIDPVSFDPSEFGIPPLLSRPPIRPNCLACWLPSEPSKTVATATAGTLTGTAPPLSSALPELRSW